MKLSKALVLSRLEYFRVTESSYKVTHTDEQEYIVQNIEQRGWRYIIMYREFTSRTSPGCSCVKHPSADRQTCRICQMNPVDERDTWGNTKDDNVNVRPQNIFNSLEANVKNITKMLLETFKEENYFILKVLLPTCVPPPWTWYTNYSLRYPGHKSSCRGRKLC